MSNDFFLLEIARLRQQDLVRQAEAERLYRQLKGNRPEWLQQAGHLLTDAVRQLKVLPQPKPATLILGKK